MGTDRCQHDLGVALGQSDGRLPDVVVPPAERVAELLDVERDAFIDARHVEGDGVNLPKKWLVHGATLHDLAFPGSVPDGAPVWRYC